MWVSNSGQDGVTKIWFTLSPKAQNQTKYIKHSFLGIKHRQQRIVSPEREREKNQLSSEGTLQGGETQLRRESWGDGTRSPRGQEPEFTEQVLQSAEK